MRSGHALLPLCTGDDIYQRRDHFSYGENITGIGIVLEGSVHIVKEDFWGNANLMAECAPGDIFGEAMRSIPPNRWK